MINKLQSYVEVTFNQKKTGNKNMIKKLEIEMSQDVYDVMQYIYETFIHGNLFKAEYSDNFITLINRILKNQTDIRITKYKNKHEFVSVDLSKKSTKDDDPMTEADKLELLMSKVDESLITKTDINIDISFNKICDRLNLSVDEEELKFYMEYISRNPLQKELMNMFISRHLGGSQEINSMTKIMYYKWLLITRDYLFSLGMRVIPMIIASNRNTNGGRSCRITCNTLNKYQPSELNNNILRKYNGIVNEEHILYVLKRIFDAKYEYWDGNEFVELDIDSNQVISEFKLYLNII